MLIYEGDNMPKFVIADNFTNDKHGLKKERTRRATLNTTPDEELENKLWVFLYDLGFTKLNIGRQCKVTYGNTKTKLSSKNIDIIAEYTVQEHQVAGQIIPEATEVRLFIECTTQKDIPVKVNQWIAESGEISRNYTNPEANIVYMFFTNQEIKNTESKRLSDNKIQCLTENNLNYFIELRKQYSRLSLYQFLAVILKGKNVRSISAIELTIPAIRCKYAADHYCYLFGIQPSKLIPITTVLHRKMTLGNELPESYQRLVQKTKINEIKRFIHEERSIFPTNIIITFETKKENYFNPLAEKLNDITYGTLTLPYQYQSITIIDGQHRLFAYDGLEESDKDLIFVIAFHQMDIETQIRTFVNINEKQKRVSSSLMWDLYPFILDASDKRVRIVAIVKKSCKDEKTSALYGVINYDKMLYSASKTMITLESVCTTFKNEDILGVLDGVVSLNGLAVNPDDFVFDMFNLFFSTLTRMAKDLWKIPDKTRNLLKSNLGTSALIILLKEVIIYLNNRSFFKGYNKSKMPLLTEEYSKLLRPLIEYVQTLKTKEEIQAQKGGGESSKINLFKVFVREINNKIPQFGTDIISKLSNPIIEQILEELKHDDESEILEVKESYLINTRRSILENKLILNESSTIRHINKTIVAFMNFLGGRIVIGIKDKTWEPVGIDETDLKHCGNTDTLKMKIQDQIEKDIPEISIYPTFSIVKHCGKTFLIIEIKRLNLERFEENELAFIKEGNVETFYIRKGGKTQSISSSEKRMYCKGVLSIIKEQEQKRVN
jgi:DNA sulfur modification protein DndB